jgi:fatty acid desaturase
MSRRESFPLQRRGIEEPSNFRFTVERIIQEQRSSASFRDIRHIRAFDVFGRIVALLAYALSAWRLNPMSPVLIVIAQMGRWGLAHQVLHHAYDHVPSCPKWLRGSEFARGWRRLWDWCDWIVPEAWQLEHNIHHKHTGGRSDPDVVESNLGFLRDAVMPRFQKVLTALLIMCTWRLTYYAPSTFIQLRRKERGLEPGTYKIKNVWMFGSVFNPVTEEGRDFWRRCILPYAGFRFLVMPLGFLVFGSAAALNVLITQCAAEILLNFYSWALIASTHTAADLHRFGHEPIRKNEWYLHQVLATANYPAGPTWKNWATGWINYQIEHHLAPNLTLRQLERVRPLIEDACIRHGVPYVSEPVPRRFAKMFAVVLGMASMKCSIDPPQNGVCANTHLCNTSRASETQGSRFLVLALVEGETLAERIQRWPIRSPTAPQLLTYSIQPSKTLLTKGLGRP